MFKNISRIAVALVVCSLFTACSSSSGISTTKTTLGAERTSGYQSPDGTFVGPRGQSKKDGTPLNIGAYGKRKMHKGDLTITKEGTKISNIDVAGVIYVNANNITISNFTAERVTQEPGKQGMLLEDGTIDGENKKDDGIQWNNFDLRRMDISRTFDGIKAQGNVSIQDSYIHDMYAFRSADAGAGGYSHNDCIQISTGADILIERNWMVNCGNNSAVFIDPDQGKISNVIVQHNYLDGGGYTLYAIASRSAENGLPTNITITNNVFGPNHIFNFATIASGVNFNENINTSGNTIKPVIDPDVS